MTTDTNRTALVTGGTSGIGLAITRHLLTMGHSVFICARDAEAVAQTVTELHGTDARISGFAGDITSQDDVTAVVARAKEMFGSIDILVNNAGRGGGGITAEISDELWDSVIKTNITGTFQMTREALRNGGLATASWGRIINIASTGGKQGVRYAVPYTASKHAVVGLTKALGLELAGTGVTVNAVCPGFCETPMAEEVRRGYAEGMGMTEEQILKQFESRIPIGRYSTPAEVAGLVGYLTTPTADAITAQAINVCGGLGNY